MNNSFVRDGIFFPDFEISNLEKELFDRFEIFIKNKGFQYLSVPSLITKETYERQNIVPWEKVFKINSEHALAGSAEQAILQYFTGKKVISQLIYAKNQCFRSEPEYEGLKRLKEFIKLEQFVFCEEKDWKDRFDLILTNATTFLNEYDIEYRVIDANKDPGYHIKKFDIEVQTRSYGWLETHSCSYFGEEQTKRFNISGATHTLSNTGIASPRILVPFLERKGFTL